jgi:hypothetical protein
MKLSAAILIIIGMCLALAPSAAYATTAQQAFGLCDKDPKCKSTVRSNGEVTFTNGTYIVSCPQEGPCTCDVCRVGGATKTRTMRPAEVTDFK